MWWKRHKRKVIAAAAVLAVLAAAFWLGGSAPGQQGWDTDTPAAALAAAPPVPDVPEASAKAPAEPAPLQAAVQDPVSAPEPTAEPNPEPAPAVIPAEPQPETSSEPEAPDAPAEPKLDAAPAPETSGDRGQTSPVPEGTPRPAEPQETEISDTAYTCTISISCAALLEHMDWLDPEKANLVPEDGWILPAVQVTFYEGESVFHVLQRTCKQNGIHLEFENTPLYHSAYIEGIQNLYEFDCGELSGWMYKVNDWFPNYGCSRYALEDGDVICWLYTCDLGEDIGGSNFPAG